MSGDVGDLVIACLRTRHNVGTRDRGCMQEQYLSQLSGVTKGGLKDDRRERK